MKRRPSAKRFVRVWMDSKSLVEVSDQLSEMGHWHMTPLRTSLYAGRLRSLGVMLPDRPARGTGPPLVNHSKTEAGRPPPMAMMPCLYSLFLLVSLAAGSGHASQRPRACRGSVAVAAVPTCLFLLASARVHARPSPYDSVTGTR